MTTDVTRREQVKQLVDIAVRAYGRIDVMINNAGLMQQSPLEHLKVDESGRLELFAWATGNSQSGWKSRPTAQTSVPDTGERGRRDSCLVSIPHSCGEVRHELRLFRWRQIHVTDRTSTAWSCRC